MNKNSLEISVIGMGRFGLFWAKELSRFADIYCYDIVSSKDSYVKEFAKFDSLGNCLKKKLIFLTIPIRDIKQFLLDNASNFHPGSVLLDCSSVKIEPKQWFEDYVPNNVNFGLFHPLFGPDSAQHDLTGHSIVYTHGRLSNENYEVLFTLLKEKLGLKIQKVDAVEHDKMMAYNLSLVHLLGRTLNEMKIADIPLKFNGLEMLERITKFVMNDRIELFQDFFAYNPFADQISKEFLTTLTKVYDEKLGGISEHGELFDLKLH